MNAMHQPGSTAAELQVHALPLAGVTLIRPKVFADSRGYFVETYQRDRFAEYGLAREFVQDNQARSVSRGTLRGLHFQLPPFAQIKLVRVLSGRIFDVVVDLRHCLPTYGKHIAIELAADTVDQLLVPVGLAHGYCTLEENTEVFYKVDNIYSPAHERGLNVFDPELAIAWPVALPDAVLSSRDRCWPSLRDLPAYFPTDPLYTSQG